jgi:hypothetical protein
MRRNVCVCVCVRAYLNGLGDGDSLGEANQLEVCEVAHVDGLRSPRSDERIGASSGARHEQRACRHQFLKRVLCVCACVCVCVLGTEPDMRTCSERIGGRERLPSRDFHSVECRR